MWSFDKNGAQDDIFADELYASSSRDSMFSSKLSAVVDDDSTLNMTVKPHQTPDSSLLISSPSASNESADAFALASSLSSNSSAQSTKVFSFAPNSAMPSSVAAEASKSSGTGDLALNSGSSSAGVSGSVSAALSRVSTFTPSHASDKPSFSVIGVSNSWATSPESHTLQSSPTQDLNSSDFSSRALHSTASSSGAVSWPQGASASSVSVPDGNASVFAQASYSK